MNSITIYPTDKVDFTDKEFDILMDFAQYLLETRQCQVTITGFHVHEEDDIDEDDPFLEKKEIKESNI